MTSATVGLLAILVPVVGAAAVAGLAGTSGRIRDRVTLAFGAATALLCALLFGALGSDPVRVSEWIPAVGVPFALRVDGLGASVAAIAGILGFVILVYARGYMRHAALEGYSLARFDALVLLFIGGMIGLALSDGLLAFYVFWELIGLCSFALIAYYHRDPRARRAGLKAFAVTRVGDIGLLVGIAALWSSGIVTFSGLEAAGLAASIAPVVALGFLLAALAKSAQVPFHGWLPDAMEAPTPVSALIHAATLVNGGVYLLARTYPVLSSVAWWPPAVVWVGASTAVLAGVAAFLERDLKRVLAYSTISQLGFMVAAVGGGAIAAAAFHLLSQAVFKALLFLAAGAVIQAAGTRDLFGMGGLRRAMPRTSAAFLAGTAAMVGIPLANGFWSKDLVLEGLLEGGHAGPALLLGAAALLTVAYAWRAYDLVFRGPPGPAGARDPEGSMAGPLLALAAAALGSGFLLEPFTAALAATMPASGIVPITLATALAGTLRGPVLLSLAATLALSGLLVLRGGWARRTRRPDGSPAVRAVRSGFGVDALFDMLARRIARASNASRRTQTGDLNVNMVGLLLALAVLLAFLLGGILR
jgi:NADH-quinone oxidoreductase subunit L